LSNYLVVQLLNEGGGQPTRTWIKHKALSDQRCDRKPCSSAGKIQEGITGFKSKDSHPDS